MWPHIIYFYIHNIEYIFQASKLCITVRVQNSKQTVNCKNTLNIKVLFLLIICINNTCNNNIHVHVATHVQYDSYSYSYSYLQYLQYK